MKKMFYEIRKKQKEMKMSHDLIVKSFKKYIS